MPKDKFKTLTHNGPLFPAPYEKKGFSFNGKELSYLAEDMLWHWAVLGEDYKKDRTFQKNFWASLKKQLPSDAPKKFPEDYEVLLKEMIALNEKMKAEKKAANTKEVREAKKAENDKKKEEYGWGELDGKRQPLGSFILEPEGIYVGRGNSPIRGCWKYAIQPEDVTINFCGDMTKAPKAPMGHKWKEVVSNRQAFVTVYYDIHLGEGVVDLHKKFGFGATSDTKQEADIKKYSKAQELCKRWNEMEAHIEKGLVSEDASTRQSALISWLILRTGIRVGNDHEAVFENGVVGASTLLCENVQIEGDTLNLHFVGKDSVKYTNSFDVPKEVAQGLLKCKMGKRDDDKLFDLASSGSVNSFLSECISFCTAKLFRTAYGTMLLAQELQASNAKKGMPQWQIKAIYDQACLAVSKKLNHQKNVAKTFHNQMDKTNERLSSAKDKAKERKAKGVEQLKKIQKDIKTAKAVYKGERLEAKLEQLKERKEKIKAQVEKAEERVEKLKAGKEFKQDAKNIALGTAKGAYSSPKVAYSFCKDMGVDISIVYNKTMQKKFEWAENTSSTFWKKYPNV